MRERRRVLEKASGFDEARLLSPAEALRTFFARAELAVPQSEIVPLESAHGRVLARPAVAREDHPNCARSTMDGFACAASIASARLRVVGDVHMGRAPGRALAAGEALRVPTGGALPLGADAVVPQEDVAFDGDEIVVRGALRTGDNVTARAEDVAAGATVLEAGRRIGSPELGVLAALGYARVVVFVKPRIAVLSTGDELVPVTAVPAVGQVRDSNRFALAGALHAMGATVVHEPLVPDTRTALRGAFRRALAENDAIVTTGGSSVGALDLVPEIVAELGAPGLLVHGLRVKPGKPTLLAAVAGKAIIGLPGNPTSALTILEAIGASIVATLCGDASGVFVYHAIAGEAFSWRPGWTWYNPVRLTARDGCLHAVPLRLRSAQTTLLARANAYAVLSGTSGRLEAGQTIRVRRFSSGGSPLDSAYQSELA